LEWACAHGCSETSARYQIGDTMILAEQLPECWQRITQGRAPLWQGQKVAAACDGVNPNDYWLIDLQINASLGVLGPTRLYNLIDAVIKRTDPDRARRQAETRSRCVNTGGDKLDPLTGWLSARLDRADTIFLEAIIQLIADTLAANGDTTNLDRRRAKALGLLSSPAAVIELIGLPTLRGMLQPPETEHDKQTLTEACTQLKPAFTPKTQIYVHLHADTITDANQLARVEKIGPILISQVKQLTHTTTIKLTPVIHVGGAGEIVDMYETPTRIRNQVLLRDPYEIAPWSSTQSRGLDLDHTNPYQPGVTGQTSAENLGPLTRRFHRAKTLAGWQLDQPTPGIFIWQTPAGQQFQVDKNGTQRLPRRE